MKKTFDLAERAVVQRINRALARENQKLYYSKSPHEKGFENGGYLIVSVTKPSIVDAGPVDLESLGRKLGVLEPFETIGK